MNNKLPNCTAAGSSTQRLKEGGSMVTRSFSSHLSVHIYYTSLCTQSLYRRCLCTSSRDPKKRIRCSYTGSFYSYLMSVCAHIFYGSLYTLIIHCIIYRQCVIYKQGRVKEAREEEPMQEVFSRICCPCVYCVRHM